MVEQSGEPLLLVCPCSFPHTVQTLGHSFPALGRPSVSFHDVLLGHGPSLHHLRPGRFLPLCSAVSLVSGRRWRTQLPGCWPPSAAQTVQAVFPHTAFTKTHAFEAQWLGSTESGSPARTRHTTWF